MPNADRASVAREVLTELMDATAFTNPAMCSKVLEYRDKVYPAPAALVTVTVVDRDGVPMEWTKNERGKWVTDAGHLISPDSWAHSFAERIAADARALAERDKRIRELEAYKALADELGTATADMMRHLADGRTFDAPGRAHAREYAPNALDRYDAVARRIAELERELESATERERARWVREQELDRERQEAICERDAARAELANARRLTPDVIERAAEAIAAKDGFAFKETNLLIDTRHIRGLARAALLAAGFQEGANG